MSVMRGRFLLVLVVISGLFLGACAKTQVVGDDRPEIVMDRLQTKADYPADGVFGIYAYHIPVPSGSPRLDSWNSDDATAYLQNVAFMYNGIEAAGYDTSSDTHRPYYWPLSGSLVFAGYSPHVDESSAVTSVSFADNLTVGRPENPHIIIDFTQNAVPGEMVDLLYFTMMPKSVSKGTTLPTGNAMMVYASKSKDNVEAYTPYFSKVPFSYTSYWGGSPAQYWPETGYLKFIAYYPSTIGTGVTGDATTDIVITGASAANGDDILYTNLTAEQSCATKPLVSMPFLHALAQVQVTAKVSDAAMTNVKVTKVVLTNPLMTGTLTIASNDASWASQAVGDPVTMNNGISGEALTDNAKSLGEGTLVVPGDQTATLTVTYTIAGLAVTTDPISIGGTWEKGKKYIYNLSIGLDEIKINPSVANWDDASVETPSVPAI